VQFLNVYELSGVSLWWKVELYLLQYLRDTSNARNQSGNTHIFVTLEQETGALLLGS
jgi:hypothetical protein